MNRTLDRFICRALWLVTPLLLIGHRATLLAADPPLRPNIVFILVDDLRWDELGCAGHPYLKTPHIDRIAKEGARFLNAFATTPLCSPSRTSFLTGCHAHTHGIIDNTDRSKLSHELDAFPRRLQGAGYETGFLGKWHMGNDDTPRPGFDYWACLKGQGTSNNPELNEDGERHKLSGYTTDLLNGRANAFIERKRDKPFLLYLAHKGLHPELAQRTDGSLSDPGAARFIPAGRHKAMYAGVKIPRRPNALVPPAGVPALERQVDSLPPLGPASGSSDATILDRQRMLMAIEEGVGQIFDALKRSGQLDKTLIVFTSDHGYWYGEHGLSVERRLAYEEGIRIPLLMCCPKLIKRGRKIEQVALNIDLAPTFLELAGVSVPDQVEGRSLARLLKGQSPPWRESFLIEYYSDKVFPRVADMGYKAVRTERYKYINYTGLEDMDELYDLQNDPCEMRNLYSLPGAQETVTKLNGEMFELMWGQSARR